MILISEKEKFFDPRKPFQSARPETHEEWQARMGGEVLAVVRSGLYLDFRFLDQALSALTPTADERCGVLATDGTILCYQPSALLQLYQKNPKYLNRLYLHTVFHCIFRHLWLRGKRDKRLWDLACDIAVENVIDGLGRKSVQRPLTWVRQHAYEEIIAQEKVAAAAPIYRWLVRQTPGVLRQLEKEFYTDDHRLWPKDAPEQPQQMPAPLPQKTWQKIGERMQTELELRDKEAGEGADAMREQIKAANRSRRGYGDFLRRFCVTREEVHLDPDEFDLNFYTYGLSVYGNLPLIEPLETRESKKIEELALVIDTSYSTSGELSPLLNDPECRTIGLGTRIFLAGAEGYVAWNGTQFNTSKETNEYGIPTSNARTIAVIGDLREMSTEYLRGMYYEKYGCSLFVGIGIPIPILDADLARRVSIRNEQIETTVVDYGNGNRVLGKTNYAALRSGEIEVGGHRIRTAPVSSLAKAREIAELLRERIRSGKFLLSEPVRPMPTGTTTKKLQIREEPGRNH